MSGIVAQNVGRPSGLIKAAAGGGGTWVEIKSLTASSSSTLSFVDGTSDVVLDSTYPVYCFKWTDIHPQTDDVVFHFQGNAAGGSGYNETMTTTLFYAYGIESGSDAALGYHANFDQAQGTAYQALCQHLGADNDQSTSGTLWLFGPSSTTFVKHYMATVSMSDPDDSANVVYTAGYFNTTSAIDEIQFKMSSGNIDDGKIKLFGIKDS